ncbi:MAG: hypothetical protein HY075_12275, partial [Deltaproteobacteria bacterium]|nr:hypothetical protein [Deltaproteobacteria bacterium]
LTPVAPTVPEFRGFTFANLNKKEAQTVTQNFDERRTNAQGEVSFDVDLSQYEGFFHLRLEAEGFEAASGRGVVAIASESVSRFPFLVGYKADGDLHYINRGAERRLQLVAVDSTFAAAQGGGLKLKLVERKYVSALMKQDDGTFKYQSVRRDRDVKSEDLTIPKQGLTLQLPSEAAGDYTYVVTDASGRELNHADFSIVAEENLSRSLDRSSELQLVLNKADYRPGEEIELQIKAPYRGAGLITIERDEVYAFKWFKAAKTSTVERIRIPEGLEGNAYVNVTFLRAMDSKEIFMSPLSYGVQPFFISLDQQRTKITLGAPEKVKPGTKLRISYSTDRATSLVLYGVNEGILQVAHYHLPDPLQHFFKKKALQVRTYQLLDLLLPEYALLREMATPSSDAGFDSLGKNLNPFRRKGEPPVAFWSGVLKAGPGARTYEYSVPDDFNGNLKIMAVTSDPHGLGATSTSTLSRGDFVISPSAPTFVAPGDQFTVSVNVSNQLEGKGATSSPRIKLEPSKHFQVVGDAAKTLDLAPGHERSVDFQLKALAELGAGDLKFTVTGANASSRIEAHLSVRPAVPYLTTVSAGVARDLPLELKPSRKLLADYRKVELGLSPVPMALGQALASYLDDFPYLCTEQLVSRGAPLLVLDVKDAAEKHAAIIATLRVRQTPDGGFSLYGRDRSANVPASLHAIEYLLEARERGLRVPEELIERGQAFLRLPSLRNASTLGEARAFAQAIYLQTLSGYVPTNDIAFLTEALEKSFKGKWEQDATAIYLAGAYKVVKVDDKGRGLVSGLRLGEYDAHDYANYQDTLSRDALLLRVVARHYPALLKKLFDFESASKFVAQIQENHFNSYSSGQALMAIGAITTASEKAGGIRELVVKAFGAQGAGDTLGLTKGISPRASVPLGATKLVVQGATELPYFYALAEKGFDAELPTVELKSRLEVAREYLAKNGSPVAKVKIGDEVDVALRVRTVDGKPAHDLALVDLYPAGFELIAQKQPDAETGASGGESSGGDEPAPASPVEGEDGGDSGALAPRRASLWAFDRFFASPLAWAEQVALKTLSVLFADFREDRVVVYANANSGLGEFRYRLKAISRGKFVVPPAFGESMYDRSVHYRGAAKSIEVE